MRYVFIISDPFYHPCRSGLKRLGELWTVSFHLFSSLSLSSSLPGQYEPRGPGRPLYQRRISSSFPDESCPNTHNSLQSQPCTSDPQDHPHLLQQQQQQQPHNYNYPLHDLWPSNGGGPAPFQSIPCNGAGALAQHRDFLGRCRTMVWPAVCVLHNKWNFCSFYVIRQLPRLFIRRRSSLKLRQQQRNRPTHTLTTPLSTSDSSPLSCPKTSSCDQTLPLRPVRGWQI